MSTVYNQLRHADAQCSLLRAILIIEQNIVSFSTGNYSKMQVVLATNGLTLAEEFESFVRQGIQPIDKK